MAIFALAPLDINANHNNAPQIRTTRRTAPQSNSNLRKQSDYHLVPKGSTRGLPIAPSSSSEEENVVPLPAQRRRGGVPQQQQQQQEHNKPKEEVVLNSTPQKKPPSKKILCATPPVSLYNKKRNVEYDRGRQLGEGGFARCYLVQNNEGKLFAAKTVAKKSLEVEKTRNKFLGEISVQRTMVHPNIVHFVECFEDDDNIYMILELCPNKSLVEMLRRRGRLTEPEARYFMLQLLGGLKYMHSKRVIHRDLKLGNIFLDENMSIKIGDFGLAALLVDENDRKTTMCGTPNYIAPEVLFGKKNGHSFEVDLWSTGVILYAMLVGKPPFQAPVVNDIYKNIRESNFDWPTDIIISSAAKSLVSALLNKDPRGRPSLDAIADHAFFRTGYFPKIIPSTATKVEPVFYTSTGAMIGNSGYNTTAMKADSKRNYLHVAKLAGIGMDENGEPFPCVGGGAGRPGSALAMDAINEREKCQGKPSSSSSSSSGSSSSGPAPLESRRPASRSAASRARDTAAAPARKEKEYILPEALSPRDGHARMRNAGLLKNVKRVPSGLNPARNVAEEDDLDLNEQKGLHRITEEAPAPPPRMGRFAPPPPPLPSKHEDLEEQPSNEAEVPLATLAKRPQRGLGIKSNILPPKLPAVFPTKRQQQQQQQQQQPQQQMPNYVRGFVPEPVIPARLSSTRQVQAPASQEVPAPVHTRPTRKAPSPVPPVVAEPVVPVDLVPAQTASLPIRTTRARRGAVQPTTSGSSQQQQVPAARPLRGMRSTVQQAEVIEAPAVAEPVRATTTTRASREPRRPTSTSSVEEVKSSQEPPAPLLPTRASRPRQYISTTATTTAAAATTTTNTTTPPQSTPLPHTSTSAILNSLLPTITNLTATLTHTLSSLPPMPAATIAATRAFRNNQPKTKAFITKWVDYTNKYGIGYTLTDGTCGTMFNDNTAIVAEKAELDNPALEGRSIYLTHEKIRRPAGAAGTERVYKRYETSMAKLTFERALSIDSRRKAEPGQQQHYTSPLLSTLSGGATPAHHKSLEAKIAMFKRFGHYMGSSLEGGHENDFVRERREGEELVFVTTYARIQQGAFFRFSDGSMQFNFSDHTKLVLSEEGRTVRFMTRDRRLFVVSCEECSLGLERGKKVFVEEGLREKLGFVRGWLKGWMRGGRIQGERRIVGMGGSGGSQEVGRQEGGEEEEGEKVVVLGDI